MSGNNVYADVSRIPLFCALVYHQRFRFGRETFFFVFFVWHSLQLHLEAKNRSYYLSKVRLEKEKTPEMTVRKCKFLHYYMYNNSRHHIESYSQRCKKKRLSLALLPCLYTFMNLNSSVCNGLRVTDA